MKAQRRHELQENVLAHELGQIKTFFNRYGNWITGVIVAVLIVLLVVWHYRSRSAAELLEQAAMFETLKQGIYEPDKQASSLEAMVDLAQDARDPLISASASMFAADFCVRQYIVDLRNPEGKQAGEYREKAKKHYNLVIEKHSDWKIFVAKAHLGLGILAENAADWTTAKSEYELVTRSLDDTYPVWVEAQRRLNNLKVWKEPFRFATTLPTTAPATAPATKPADTQPASKPALTDAEK
ncbi:MAG: tetratricopeptide repeat protein [Phycisphaerae bacterium]|nr:tetratricopeptide repeat protein [Phycisphaerae bacterium]